MQTLEDEPMVFTLRVFIYGLAAITAGPNQSLNVVLPKTDGGIECHEHTVAVGMSGKSCSSGLVAPGVTGCGSTDGLEEVVGFWPKLKSGMPDSDSVEIGNLELYVRLGARDKFLTPEMVGWEEEVDAKFPPENRFPVDISYQDDFRWLIDLTGLINRSPLMEQTRFRANLAGGEVSVCHFATSFDGGVDTKNVPFFGFSDPAGKMGSWSQVLPDLVMWEREFPEGDGIRFDLREFSGTLMRSAFVEPMSCPEDPGKNCILLFLSHRPEEFEEGDACYDGKANIVARHFSMLYDLFGWSDAYARPLPRVEGDLPAFGPHELLCGTKIGADRLYLLGFELSGTSPPSPTSRTSCPIVR
jgi:hypothetical protein